MTGLEAVPEDLRRRVGLDGMRGQRLRFRTVRQGNFTVALVFDTEDLVGVGVAKRSPKDSDQPTNGARLALTRAMRRWWWRV